MFAPCYLSHRKVEKKRGFGGARVKVEIKTGGIERWLLSLPLSCLSAAKT